MKPAGRFPLLALFVLLGLGMRSDAGEPGSAERAPLNPLAAFDPAKLDGFLGRPLFSPTRRPPPPPSPPPAPTEAAPVEAAPVEIAPPAIRLVGITRTPKGSVAQLVRDEDSQRLSVRVGDALGEWKVASIEASGVTLKLGEREARFEIFRGHPAGAPGAEADTGERQRTQSQDNL